MLWATDSPFRVHPLNDVSANLVVLGEHAVDVLILLPFLILHLRTLTSLDWLFLAIIAGVSGVISLSIYYRGFTTTKASVATIAELGFPVGAVVINWIFLGAALEPMQIVGTFLLFLSVLQLTSVNAQMPSADGVVATTVWR